MIGIDLSWLVMVFVLAITNARAYHPILGFDSIGGTDLLLSANNEIWKNTGNYEKAIQVYKTYIKNNGEENE